MYIKKNCLFNVFDDFRKHSKATTPGTPKSDRRGLDISPANTPILSSSPLNSPLNRTPIKKVNRSSSAEVRHDKDTGSGGSNHSSGSSTPKLPLQDSDTVQSMSDSESVISFHGLSRNNNTGIFPNIEFLRELTEGYDDMEEDAGNVKEMLVQLQSLVSFKV